MCAIAGAGAAGVAAVVSLGPPETAVALGPEPELVAGGGAGPLRIEAAKVGPPRGADGGAVVQLLGAGGSAYALVPALGVLVSCLLAHGDGRDRNR